jgi:hypothetical protein
MFPTGQGRTAATAQKRPLADFWSIEHDAPLAGATFRSRMLPILALGSMQDPPAKAMKVLRTGERVDVVFSEPGCVRRWFLRALVVPAGAARPLPLFQKIYAWRAGFRAIRMERLREALG